MTGIKIYHLRFPILIGLFCLSAILLSSCASSNISRSAANKIDSAYQSGNNTITHMGDNDISAYPNSSSVVQGAVTGTAVGAVVGGIITSSAAGVIPGAGVGLIFGGVIGGFLDHHETLQDQLENHGVKVIILGDQILIVIPSSQLFHDMNSEIFPAAYPTLHLVERLLNTYATMSVRITSYTEEAGSNRVNLSLSVSRAESVERALRTKVNTRMIYAIGKGDCHLVEEEGGALNDRIEITAEKYPV